MDNGKIIVIPTSGLANRLRIISSSIKLARESNKKLIIYWYKSNELHAEFSDLFEHSLNLPVKRIPFNYKIWVLMRRFSSKLFGLEKWYIKQFNFDFTFLDSMAPEVWKNRINLQEEVNKAKNVFICSYEEINYFDSADYQLFKPVLEIQNKIDSLARLFQPNIIGIHIRTTDNAESIINSPLHLFEKKIEEELRKDANVTFFLATDNESYQSRLLKKFGKEKIIFYKKEFRREVTQGIKDAVVDLFCLAKTSKIYGSHFSSFSYIPGRIGQIPVQILNLESET
jgi:hypothetical protein